MSRYTHVPVLSNEVLQHLNLKDGGIYVDCTAGRGGHINGVINSGVKDLTVIAIDRDASNCEFLEDKYKNQKNKIHVVHSDYKFFDDILKFHGINKVDAILFDLGFSSVHIDDPSRGFSFAKNGPLDMRYDVGQSLTAEDIVNDYSEDELRRIIRDYGEENFYKSIVKWIINTRSETRIKTTFELRELIHKAIPGKFKRAKSVDPATKTFQAIRIEVNSEFESLKTGLAKAIDLLNPNGRLCVITFHSLEDRIVKQMINKCINPCICPRGLIECVCGRKPTLKWIVKTPITAGEDELNLNPRSRSAKLRIAERL